MIFSKHNIFSRIEGTDEYYIVNVLSGNADILSKEKGEEILAGRYTDVDEYITKGYLVDEAAEEKLYRKRYADFIDTRDSDEIQLFFVPWYSCNFGCSYCYQEGYTNEVHLPDRATIDAFFAYVAQTFAGRKKYVTIFGGEPLLPSPAYRDVISYLLTKAKEASLEVAFVTNGYSLEHYVDLLRGHAIREVQVTLDGTAALHDERRPLKGGGATFDRIVCGIDAALAQNITINLRMVVDKLNIGDLPALSRFAISKGWTKHPQFKTQLGRNYELHFCQSDRDKLLTRIEMYKEIYTLLHTNPEILEFHRPSFSIAQYLFEHGELPNPLYDSCPGTKTEWAFDYTGRIYACTATVGKSAESLGTFHPRVTLDAAMIEQWEERDVTTIPECTSCNLRLACGGGCASVAFNKFGAIQKPDCNPVTELLGLGIAAYR